jgi:DNA repair exonuclease SbcCD nuclease subunit
MNRLESGYVPSPSTGRQVRILHLSDLHFGTKHAAKNQDYLLAVIKDELHSRFDRVVITGDLFDSIWKRKWRAFESFRQSLRLITDNDPIVIPGNHDSRIMGNRFWKFGESYRYLAELGVRPLHDDATL